MATQYKEFKDTVDKYLYEKKSPFRPLFEWLENKTGVKRFYLFLMLIVFLGLYLVFGYAAQLLCNLIGFLYPAYTSIKAIESPNKGDDTKWLIYWTVFAFFSIIEFPSDILLSWFPLYWLIKCIFMVWLFLPINANGSILLYTHVIKPFFLKHCNRIDGVFANIAGSAAQVISEAAQVDKHD